jgi:hypothetical protein
MRRGIAGLVVAAALAQAAPAGATVTGINEGNFLRGASHVFYFLVSNNVGAADLRVCYYKWNGASFTRLNALPCQSSGIASGNYNYFTYTVNDLGSFNGATYEVCASQYYNGTEGSISCGNTAGSGVPPRVDNTPPSITLGVGGAADYTTNPAFPITINYNDATSAPFHKGFAESGDTILTTCVQQGATIDAVCTADNQFAQSTGCAQTISYPNVNDRRVANFSCTTTVNADGKWWVCVHLTDDAWDGTHTGNVAAGYRSTGGDAGHEGNRTETCSYLTLDRVGPSIGTTTATPSTPAPGQSVAFATSATDATSGVASYAWAFGDGATGTGASANHAYSTAGSKTATVTVTDNAGNSSSKQVSVNVVAPDTSAPDTNITDGPSGSTTATSAQFSFTATESPSTFECKLDSGAYAACTSPKSYTGLSVGSHTFSVRAKDAANNTDASPAARAWTVTAPSTGGGGGTTDPGGGGTTGGGTTDPGGGTTGTGAGDTGGGTSTPTGVTTTGTDAPSGGSATGSTQISKQIAKARTRTLVINGLTVTVPLAISLAKTKRRMPALLKAAKAGGVRFTLRLGAVTKRTAGLTFRKPGSAGFNLSLGPRLGPGTYLLAVAFTRKGSSRSVTKTFSVKIRS